MAEKNAIRRQIFRDQVYEAALHLFATRGINGVSMRALARVMGSSTMKTYHYFQDKNEVLAEVLTRTFNRFCDVLDAADMLPGTAREKVMAKASAYVQFAQQEPESYHIMFELVHPVENTYPDMLVAVKRIRKSMLKSVHALVSEGIIAGDTEMLEHALWSDIHGPVSLCLAGKFIPEVSLDDIVARQVRGFIMQYAPATDPAI